MVRIPSTIEMAGQLTAELLSMLGDCAPVRPAFGLKHACSSYPLAVAALLKGHAVKSEADLMAVLEVCSDEVVLELAVPILFDVMHNTEFVESLERNHPLGA
jgi:hypothetical protein